MERPTKRQIEEWVACMESALIDLEETTASWRNRIADTKMRSALAGIEVAAKRLGDLIGHLAPPSTV